MTATKAIEEEKEGMRRWRSRGRGNGVPEGGGTEGGGHWRGPGGEGRDGMRARHGLVREEEDLGGLGLSGGFARSGVQQHRIASHANLTLTLHFHMWRKSSRNFENTAICSSLAFTGSVVLRCRLAWHFRAGFERVRIGSWGL